MPHDYCRKSKNSKKRECENNAKRGPQGSQSHDARPNHKRDDHRSHCRENESGSQQSSGDDGDSEDLFRTVISKVSEGEAECELRDHLYELGERFVVTSPAGSPKAMVGLAADNSGSSRLGGRKRSLNLLALRDKTRSHCSVRRHLGQYLIDFGCRIDAPAIDLPDRVARSDPNLVERTARRNRPDHHSTST